MKALKIFIMIQCKKIFTVNTNELVFGMFMNHLKLHINKL